MANESNEKRELAEANAREVRRIFGVTVRNIRKLRGWSQEELARQLSEIGVTMHQTTVAKMENGARPTSVDELVLVARVLGVRPADLTPPEDPDRENVRGRLAELKAINDEIRQRRATVEAITEGLEELIARREAATTDFFDALRGSQAVVLPIWERAEIVHTLAEMQRADEAAMTVEELAEFEARMAVIRARYDALEEDADGEHQEAP